MYTGIDVCPFCLLWFTDKHMIYVTDEVKNAEQVELDQIPLPDMPAGQPSKSICVVIWL